MVAIGDDSRAARLRGLSIRSYRFVGYVITGIIAGWLGVLLMSHLGNASIGQGQAYLLDGYAAALIGMTFGRSIGVKALGTVLGAIFLGVLSNGMAIAAYDPALIQLAKALILILGLIAAGVTRNLRFG